MSTCFLTPGTICVFCYLRAGSLSKGHHCTSKGVKCLNVCLFTQYIWPEMFPVGVYKYLFCFLGNCIQITSGKWKGLLINLDQRKKRRLLSLPQNNARPKYSIQPEVLRSFFNLKRIESFIIFYEFYSYKHFVYLGPNILEESLFLNKNHKEI